MFGKVCSGFREIQNLALPLTGTCDFPMPRIPLCDSGIIIDQASRDGGRLEGSVHSLLKDVSEAASTLVPRSPSHVGVAR